MENLTLNASYELLDFENAKVQTLSLEQLERTYRENDITGQPIKGIYHYELIRQIQHIANMQGLEAHIDEIFAAQNRDRSEPGVVILPQIEDIYGKNAVEAHVLRRVFTNINLKKLENEEHTANIAIAFSQQGIEIAFGNMVKICHNQCILGKEKYVKNYGKGKKTIQEMFDTVKKWMGAAERTITEEREKIEEMKKIRLKPEQVLQIIGNLTAMRVAHDTSNKNIKSQNDYPLNQAQISQFTEMLLIKQFEQQYITIWDIYNTATELYKADKMEIPNMLTQNIAMAEMVTGYIEQI